MNSPLLVVCLNPPFNELSFLIILEKMKLIDVLSIDLMRPEKV